jgi:UDP-2,3-diacylglucosamine pyrophosphatase LpxH
VISDLHLGTRNSACVLERPAALEALVAALDGIDRLVLLGDTIELRQRPARDALAAAEPVLRALGAAMAEKEIVLVPGNHDHGIARRWLDEAPPLSLEERLAPATGSPLAAAMADRLAPARTELAYPGVWLRDDVYASHGHYLDVHGTVPSFERIGAGLMTRLAGAPPDSGATPSDYEAILAPIYAWIDAAAARSGDSRRAAGSGRSAQAWGALAGPGRRTLRRRALIAGFPVGIAALNRAGVGPLHADVSGAALRRGLLDGLKSALARLGVRAPHVVFGHTHRPGMLPGDDAAEWRAGETRLHNTGSWVYEPHFIGGRGPRAPHWPGSAVALGEHGEPELRQLLADVPEAELRPARARG